MKLKIQSIKNYFKSKKNRGLEPVFFEKIGDQKSSRDEMLKNLIKACEHDILTVFICSFPKKNRYYYNKKII